MLDYRFHYRRNLPHYQPADATFFTTFRLAGSIPAEVLLRLRDDHDRAIAGLAGQLASPERGELLYEEQRRAFGRLDAELGLSECGPRWLQDPTIANVVVDTLKYWQGRRYTLCATCVMPNHIHMVFTPLKNADDTFYSLATIMHSIKRYTAHQANLFLRRTGEFWQPENYDHVVRGPAELRRIIEYVLSNPVKAGLVKEWQSWPWSYVNLEGEL